MLNRFASIVTGEHDFSTFAGSRDVNESKVRIVYSSSFYPSGEFIVYRIQANSFLYRMVRSIIGTILEHMEFGKSESEFMRVVEARSRSAAGPTAPAKGLFLDKVIYGTTGEVLSLFENHRNGTSINVE
jgi:tRNA pseudouridine38-40 synthase